MSVVIELKNLQNLKELAGQILLVRKDEIEDDRLDGQHWFITVLSQADQIQRRQRAWALRRALYEEEAA